MSPLRPKEPKPVTPGEFFGGAHPVFKLGETPSPDQCLCFDLQGPSGGIWYVDVITGAVSGELDGAPAARVVMTADDFARLLDGKLAMAERLAAGHVHYMGEAERLSQFLRLIA